MRESEKMKILKFQSKAKEIAQNLLEEAKKNEPAITKELKEIAKLKKAKLVGLENRFKEESSLVRKLIEHAKFWNSSITREAKRNNDTLRYTMIFPVENYCFGYQEVLTELENRRYEVRKIWDAWALAESPDDTGYRGINTTIKSSQNQKFELQFHTEESFAFKTETHGLYEESRNPQISKQRKAEIEIIMRDLAVEIQRPKEI